jgi:hypothetical protein
MSKNIFNPEGGYAQRFINNQSKKIKFPSFKYLDAQLHPKYKNHIVVLSESHFPEDAKMTYCFETPIYEINMLDTDETTKTHFEESLIEVETLILEDKRKTKEVYTKTIGRYLYGKTKRTPNSSKFENADSQSEESKGLGLYNGNDSEDKDSKHTESSGGDLNEGGNVDEKVNNKFRCVHLGAFENILLLNFINCIECTFYYTYCANILSSDCFIYRSFVI